jgi:hypothetical protein
MAQVTPAIPASQIVNVIPSVLSAGGNALDLIGLILTTNPRVPVGQVQSFPSSAAVGAYFGYTSDEAALAAIYFLGFDNSTAKPGSLLFWQYVWQNEVSAYLRGGNVASLPLATLQTLTGSLSVTIDGTVKTASSLNFAGATSYSNAAELIAAGLGIEGVQSASFQGSIAASVLTVASVNDGELAAEFTASITATTMTVTAMTSGSISNGLVLTGAGVTSGTTIVGQVSGVTGGIGTYTVSASQTVAGEAMSAYQPAGSIAVGDAVTGATVPAGTYIVGLGTGSGGVGTYNLSTTSTVATEAMESFTPAVQYDSVSGAFVIYSGTIGTGSTIGFASGTLANALLLTQAQGALLSQGAGLSTPAGDMSTITTITQNWCSFMTTFEPVSSDKIAFAAWTNTSGEGAEYVYCMWDTNVLNTEVGGPSPAVAAINAANYSGTAMIYSNPLVDATGQLAAFLMGAIASINFTQTQGTATMCFKSQTGLPPHVVNGTVASYLKGYGLNFYGDFTTANQSFVWFYYGTITGEFNYIDAYVNEVWIDNQIQLAMMVLLKNTLSLPYNIPGYGLVEAAALDPIDAAVNFGAIQAGVTLSNAEAAEINNSAGLIIAPIVQQRGWYFLVLDAAPQARTPRTSPPCSLFYTNGGSIQQLNIASIQVQ